MSGMNTPASKTPPYFLMSFIPALAYWILESYFSLEIALIGGIVLGLIEMLIEKKISGHVHTLSKVNIALIVVLGIISLIAKEGIWFKLQPTLTGFGVASYLIFKKVKGESLMVDMMKDMGQQKLPMPPIFYKTIEWHLCLFLVGFAIFMAKVAVYETTATWLFWKTGGFYLVFGAFMVVEIIFLRWRLKKGSG
jgi:intracellular septation protein